jgi:hypothetical protein
MQKVTAQAEDQTAFETREEEPVWATRRTGPTIATALRRPMAILTPLALTAFFGKSHPDRKVVPFTETLKCRFTPREKERISDAMSRTFMEITTMEDTLALLKKKYKADIEAKQAEHKDLAQKHYAGFEMRGVECHKIFDYRDNTVRLVRLDTFEVISERIMTGEERQRGLAL